jgi:Putative Zn-dependent protease, contains TPR repeats
MIDDPRLARVQILMHQGKYAEAGQALRNLLAENPNDVHYLALMAEVQFQQDDHEAARRIIDNAIGLAPDWPHLFYIKARIALHGQHVDEAEGLLKQCISMDPHDAHFFALLAHIRLLRKQYQEALDLANQALELDAEHLLALNTRSTALLKLNKAEESFRTIEGALREDPTNAYTHANYGWSLLEKGDHKKALEHFKEALKTDPNYAYAQSGMVEALKAANPVYRLFLKYAFWIGNLTAKYQWAVIIGFYVAYRILNGLASSNEALAPYFAPLATGLAIIAFSTWVINPISNLFLRFNRYGQFLLDRKEKISSNFVAISLLIFIAGISLYCILADERYLAPGVFGLAMMLPLSVMLMPSKPKNMLLMYTIGMAVVGIVAIADTFATGNLINTWSSVFLVAFIVFQWVANFLMIKQSNR